MQELGATNSGSLGAACSASMPPKPCATVAFPSLQTPSPKDEALTQETSDGTIPEGLPEIVGGNWGHEPQNAVDDQTEQTVRTPSVITEQTEQTLSDQIEQTAQTELTPHTNGEQTPLVGHPYSAKSAKEESSLAALAPSRLAFLRHILAHRSRFDSEYTPWARVSQDTGLSLIAVRRSAKDLAERGIIRTEFDELHRRGSRIYVREEYAQILAAMSKSLTSKGSAWFKAGGEPTELSSAIPSEPTERTDPTEPTPLKKDRLREIHPSEEIAERLWRLSDELFAHHWPTLFAVGLSANDVREAIESLRAVGKSTARLMDGLEHAEFELSTRQGPMLDAQGRIIGDLAQYVGKALKKTGYYRRPEGYVSPAEQAEKDAKEEAQKMELARKEREAAEYQAWLGSLPLEQRTSIEKGGFPGPAEKKLITAWIKSMKEPGVRSMVDPQQAGLLTNPQA